MQEGLLEVRELDKGVSAVVGLAAAHPAARSFAAPPRPPEKDKDKDKAGQEYTPPLVREMLCVTAAVLPLFPGLKSVPIRAPALVAAAASANASALQEGHGPAAAGGARRAHRLRQVAGPGLRRPEGRRRAGRPAGQRRRQAGTGALAASGSTRPSGPR